MILQQKEMDAIRDLQTREKSCVEKYKRYADQAKDTELRNLFQNLQEKEQHHYDTLGKILNGQVPCCDCNDSEGKEYQPKATYANGGNEADKKNDEFLVTDCIGTEKLVSGEYNTNVFKFSEASVRKVLADIQVEEQNHAEMLYKYKMVNCMS